MCDVCFELITTQSPVPFCLYELLDSGLILTCTGLFNIAISLMVLLPCIEWRRSTKGEAWLGVHPCMGFSAF